MENLPSPVGGGLGQEEVEVVGEATEDELLRSAALDRLGAVTSAAQALGPDEFTYADAVARWGWSQNVASRELRRLVSEGVLERAWRYDPRVGKRVVGFRFVDRGAET